MGKEYIPIIPILIESLEETYNKPRAGYHVSDIVICPRASVFSKIDPVPLGMRELNFFTSGRAVHEAYQELFTMFPGRFQEREVWVSRKTKIILQLDENDLALKKHPEEFKSFLSNRGIDMDTDIVAHIDLYDAVNNQPYEAKSSRTKGLEKPKTFHIAQVKYYMALVDAEWGGIFYQFLNHFEDKPFAEFPIHMSKEERRETLDKLIMEIDNYDKALKARNPSSARHVMDMGREWNWKCWNEDWKTKLRTASCPYINECCKMQGKSTEDILGIREREPRKEEKRSGPDAGASPDLLAKYVL